MKRFTHGGMGPIVGIQVNDKIESWTGTIDPAATASKPNFSGGITNRPNKFQRPLQASCIKPAKTEEKRRQTRRPGSLIRGPRHGVPWGSDELSLTHFSPDLESRDDCTARVTHAMFPARGLFGKK